MSIGNVKKRREGSRHRREKAEMELGEIRAACSQYLSPDYKYPSAAPPNAAARRLEEH